MNAAGGSDVATYYLSGEYFREQNVIPINAQQRLNLRSNLRGQLAKSLDVQLNIGYVNSDLRRPQNDNNVQGLVSGALLGNGADCGPYGVTSTGANARFPVMCGTDTTSRGYFNGQIPQEIFNINTRQFVQRLTSGVVSNWTPLSWLAVNGTLGADIDNRNDNETVQPNLVFTSQKSVDGFRRVFRAQVYNYTAGLSGTATYDFSPTVKLTSTLASQYTDILFTRTDAEGFKLLAGTLGHWIVPMHASTLARQRRTSAPSASSAERRWHGVIGSSSRVVCVPIVTAPSAPITLASAIPRSARHM